MAEKEIKMDETEDDGVDIAISAIGNQAGFTAGYYKGKISLKVRPKQDKKEMMYRKSSAHGGRRREQGSNFGTRRR